MKIQNKLSLLVLILSLASNTLLAKTQSLSMQMIKEAQKEVGQMPAAKLKKLIDDEADIIILDIRQSSQKIDGAIYADESYEITRGELEFEVMSKIKDRNALIVTYCRGGKRAALAAQTLRRLGYKNATSLKDGLRGWAREGYPIETAIGVMKLIEEYK